MTYTLTIETDNGVDITSYTTMDAAMADADRARRNLEGDTLIVTIEVTAD